MKIAIVHEMLVKMGGAERVLVSLLKKYPESDVYTLLYNQKNCSAIKTIRPITTSRLQKWYDMGIPKQLLLRGMPRAIEDFDFTGYDVVISSSSAFAHGVITPSNIPHISYIHAPMRYVWDYTHTYMQEKTQGWKKILFLPLLWTFSSLRIWDCVASNRSEVIIANSKTTQQRIQKYWRKDSQVVYPPVSVDRFTVSQENDGSYLIVSMLEPFKKIDIAIEAFKAMPDKNLIIIGDGSQYEVFKEKIGNAANIQLLGKKTDEEVVEYMKRCKALIFPGKEDFGITPVEAMACGKPVVFFREGGVCESVIDGATGIGFSHQTSESLSQAINILEGTTFDPLIIRNRAENFSEEHFHEKIDRLVSSFLS